MIKYSLRGVLIACCLIALFSGGCGKSGSQTVATVGDHKITTADVDEYLIRLRMTFPDAQTEFDKKREILDSLVVTRLLIQGAYEKGIDKSEELARVVDQNKKRFLVSALYQKHIGSQIEPTEADIQDFYNRLEYRVRASHILVKDLDTAQALFERVKNGENFEQLAFEYSIDPDAPRNKGDLGYFLWGATVDEFQQAAFAMEPGEVSPPVKSQFGYHIIKLVDKQINETRTEFETMKESIASNLRRRNSTLMTMDYFKALAAKYPVAIDTATCEYLLHKREQLYPPMVLANLPRNDFDPEALDRNEKELVIATWAGNQMSVFEYLRLLRDVPARSRPDLDQYDSLSRVVFELKKMDILGIEALAEGLDSDEDYLLQVKTFKELNMADIMKNDSIIVPVPPDDATLRQYYEEHIDEFTTPAKIHVHEILLSDEIKARQLKKQLTSLNGFKKAAADLTERPGKRSRNGDLGYIEEKWYPEIYRAAYNTMVGRVGGPVPTGGKYSIFYVVDKIEPEVSGFLSVKRTLADKVRREQKNEAISTWIDERLKMTNVDINEKALWDSIDEDRYVQVVPPDTTGS